MKTIKNVIDSEQLYLSNNEEVCQKETNLWRAVIMQSLDDLLLPPSNSKYRRWRKRAVKWFMDADEDFYTVCGNANLSPRKILDIAHRNIAKIKIDDLE